MSKKIIAILLVLTLALSIVAIPVGAASIQIPDSVKQSVLNKVYVVLEKALYKMLNVMSKYWPGYDKGWSTLENYTAKAFYPGESKFDNQVKPNSQWSMGYAGASLLDGLDIMNGEYYMAGSLEPWKGRVPTVIHDDQRVRVFALSDGARGTVIDAVIDGFGLARGDVEEIRSRIASFAAKYNVVSINVSVLHQHSLIDTLGMNVPLVQALAVNTADSVVNGALDQFKCTKNKTFMENLYNKTVECMEEAVKTMKPGTLSYGSADISQYIRDKRDPQSFDGNLHRIRFVPSDGSAETWILEAGIHAVDFGASTSELSADFPYYIEKTINEKAHANVVYVQGAELAITTNRTLTDTQGAADIDNVKAYGAALGDIAIGIQDTATLDPVLNIALKEIPLSVNNEVLALATREDLVSSVVVKDGKGYKMITEIGYMELGNTVGIFICPGEFEPAIFYGGAATKEQSWNNTSWDYAPLATTSGCKEVLVFGLCNDQCGYVLTDNEYHTIFTENEEINATSGTVGSELTQAYMNLIASVR